MKVYINNKLIYLNAIIVDKRFICFAAIVLEYFYSEYKFKRLYFNIKINFFMILQTFY